jgi:hypothetical protein
MAKGFARHPISMIEDKTRTLILSRRPDVASAIFIL